MTEIAVVEHERVRLGAIVFAVLAALTAIEFILAITNPPLLLALLTVIAIGKAWAIILYFMHIRQLRGSGHA